MAPAVLVLNGGSSNLKFSVFLDDDPPRPLLRGQIERAGRNWRFVVRDGTKVIVEERWPDGTRGTETADLVEFLYRLVPDRHSSSASHRRSGPSHCAWRRSLQRSMPGRRQRARGTRNVDPTRAAAPTPQSGGCPYHREASAGRAAGRVFRYGLSPDTATPRAGVRVAAALPGRGSQALRIPWSVVQIHRITPSAVRRAGGKAGVRWLLTWVAAAVSVRSTADEASRRR